MSFHGLIGGTLIVIVKSERYSPGIIGSELSESLETSWQNHIRSTPQHAGIQLLRLTDQVCLKRPSVDEHCGIRQMSAGSKVTSVKIPVIKLFQVDCIGTENGNRLVNKIGNVVQE